MQAESDEADVDRPVGPPPRPKGSDPSSPGGEVAAPAEAPTAEAPAEAEGAGESAAPTRPDPSPEAETPSAADVEGAGVAPGAADAIPQRRSGADAGGSGFPREVVRFLTTLAQAIQKHSMYPDGHPALEPAVEAVAETLEVLFRDRAVVSVGIASSQLTVEGSESDPDHPRFSFLASRLHRHELVSVSLAAGVGHDELAAFLAAAGTEPDLAEEMLGQRAARGEPDWPHIRLQPIRYEQFGLARKDQGSSRATGTGRASKLWLGLARAALMSDAVGTENGGPIAALGEFDDEAVARAVEDYSSEPAYAQDILNHLTKVSRELTNAEGEAAAELKRRTSRLIALVKPEALRQVLREAGDSHERRQLLLDASQWMESQSVVKLVRATAGVEKQDISHFLLMMISKLGQHASSGPPVSRPEAEQALRDQVEQLVRNWSLADAVPISYGEALERMSTNMSATDPAHGEVVAVEPERVIRMALELDTEGETVWTSVEKLAESGRLGSLVQILDEAPEEAELAGRIWERFASPDTLVRVLEEEPPDYETLDHLVDFLGVRAAEPLLEALAEAESRAVRRQLYSRLVDLGPDISPAALEWLEDDRWYVKRNMLALMGEFEEWPVEWSPEPYADHSHPAVRREALKIMLRLPEHRERAVCGLLRDSDPRALTLGLGAAQERPPAAAAPRLMQLARNEEVHTELRVMAIRALVPLAPDEALPALLELVYRPRSWLDRLLRRRRLAERSPVVLAGLEAVAAGWSGNPRADRVLARAAKSGDPEVRAAGTPERGIS